MTLATATIERFTETTAALTPVTETPIVRNPTGPEANRPGSPFDMMLYVTRIDTGDERYGDVVGTVQTVTASPSRDGWFRRNENGNLQRLYGAPLNEPMVNGHYYRTLGGRNLLARYNDDDHAGDRHVASLPMSMIAGDGAPWPFPEDGMALWEGTPYIEVEAPALSPVPAEPTLAGEELTDAHQFLPATAPEFDPSFGFGLPEADGRVRLNPDLEVGELYIYWSSDLARDRSSMSEIRMVAALAPEDGEPTFSHLGYWQIERQDGEDKPYFYSGRRTVLDSGTPKAWVKLALTVPEADDSESGTTVAMWARTRSAELGEFAEFNEATNALAKDNDWCSEYEDIVTKVGMEGRTKTMHDYDVDVSTTISFEADSVSSRMDSQITDDYGIPGFSGNSARFRGDVTVTIRVSDVDDDEDVEDQIDSDMVRDHINDMMSGIDDLDIDDWSVGTTRRIDN